MTTYPDTLRYQNETLYFHEETLLSGVLGKPTRISYVNSKDEIKLMQFQFPNMSPIDWERLQAENTEPHRPTIDYRIRRANNPASKEMRRAWQRNWWNTNKDELNRRRREKSKAMRGQS